MRVANDRYSTGLDLATKLLTLAFATAMAVDVWRANERKAADAEVASAVSDVYSWLNEPSSFPRDATTSAATSWSWSTGSRKSTAGASAPRSRKMRARSSRGCAAGGEPYSNQDA